MDFIIRLAEEFFKKHKRLARYRRIFAFLAAVVVFATTYELILPAITMDRQLAFRSPGVQVGVVNDQRKGIEFTEDDSFAADSAGEDAFEAGFPEEGDFFEDDTGVAGDGYAEDFSSDGTGSADDWMQAENPGAGDTWENADEIVPGADSAGDDYSGSDADGSLTDADGTGVNASAGDDLAGVPSDSSDPENSGADISVPENAGVVVGMVSLFFRESVLFRLLMEAMPTLISRIMASTTCTVPNASFFFTGVSSILSAREITLRSSQGSFLIPETASSRQFFSFSFFINAISYQLCFQLLPCSFHPAGYSRL